MDDLSVYDGKKTTPLGVDNFKKMVTRNDPPYYYVDKSMLIFEILQNGAAVNLIPRPRRFGKSLNLDMMDRFLSIGTSRKLFSNLKISQREEFCKRHQGKYPVLHLDWKDVAGETYEEACNMLVAELQSVAQRMKSLTKSKYLDADDLEKYNTILHLDKMPQKEKDEKAKFRAALKTAPFVLTELMQKHYRKKVVVLIDEYDVPLNNAYTSGYYSKMNSLIRGIFSKLLKGNENLAFAVLMGCLPIAKESLFTGLNNLRVWTGKSNFVGEYFGFTEDEVKDILEYYQFPEMLETMRDWFEGFRFGRSRVSCPWDVLSFADQCRLGGPGEPQKFWVNTSGNDIIKLLLSRADSAAQKDYIDLMAGKSIWKTITSELTFSDLDNKGSNAIWSMMVATGYLAVRSEDDGISELAVTNREIRWLLSNSLQDWLCSKYSAKTGDITAFSTALKRGDPDAAETALRSILSGMFTAHTSARSVKRREDLYQGLLLGLLRQNWMVRAEVQSGEGYVDVYFRVSDAQGIVIEVKDAGRRTKLDSVCSEALKQIQDNRYAEALLEQGCSSVLCYGIAFQKADCKVMLKLQQGES